jgi:tetratricopeptide (TPR) repeat protein
MPNNLKNSSQNSATDSNAPSQPVNEDFIRLHDRAGNLVLVSRENYWTGTAEPMLRAHWDKPNELYRACVQSLQDGFASKPELLEAAQRLHDIDTIPERGMTILGLALSKSGRIKEARTLFESSLSLYPDSGNLRTNLAKVLWYDGEQEKSEKVLREGLDLDPNQENGLGWWTAIQRERGGNDAYISALREIANVPGSWRAQLTLAHLCLNEGRNEEGIVMLRKSLAAYPDNPTVIDALAGGLFRAQDWEGMIATIVPIYDPARHESQTGLGLLRAYLSLGRRSEGEALLIRMEQLNRPDLKPQLALFRQQLSAL